jgi:hypothetical protein
MVIYTCILQKGKEYYECYEGFIHFDGEEFEDYRNISIPSSSCEFNLFKKILERTQIIPFIPKKGEYKIFFESINSVF